MSVPREITLSPAASSAPQGLSPARTVPAVDRASDAQVTALAKALAGRRVAVLTGAGCSTESGIPDYRGEGTRRRARSPVQYADFIRSEAARRRYWARSVIGWPQIRATDPNPTHQALAALETRGFMGPITQNVDRLHQRAGSRAVIELHGALEEVVCLGCGRLSSRDDLQGRLLDLNPRFLRVAADIAPDGDADFEGSLGETFELVGCPRCGGVLKPHVVFFGESVPRARVEAAFARVEGADALIVLGTSLAVFSGYRFARRAHELGRRIYVVNVGETRADKLSTMKIEARLGDVLPRLLSALGG